MEATPHCFRDALLALTQQTSVADALLSFVRELEREYSAAQDITLFIFALRCFFCWHRAEELCDQAAEVKRIEEIWVAQNEEIYTTWLSSMEDNAASLKWAKWTFQAKTSILAEFLTQCQKTIS